MRQTIIDIIDIIDIITIMRTFYTPQSVRDYKTDNRTRSAPWADPHVE